MYFSEDLFVNPYTLNIFCDASMRNYNKGKNFGDGCYGAIALCENRKIDSMYRICSNTTNNNSEIKAIRNGVILADQYKGNYSYINIFSDSQISVFGIRDRIFNWTVGRDNDLYGYNNARIQSQEIFIQIVEMVVDNNLHINFWHQKGHVKTNNFKSLENAAHVFCASNGIREGVDFNFIKYISDNNNRVDIMTGKILAKHKTSSIIKYKDALVFGIKDDFDETKEQYKSQINGGLYHG